MVAVFIGWGYQNAAVVKIIGKSQLETLDGKDFIRSIERISEQTYLNIGDKKKE